MTSLAITTVVLYMILAEYNDHDIDTFECQVQLSSLVTWRWASFWFRSGFDCILLLRSSEQHLTWDWRFLEAQYCRHGWPPNQVSITAQHRGWSESGESSYLSCSVLKNAVASLPQGCVFVGDSSCAAWSAVIRAHMTAFKVTHKWRVKFSIYYALHHRYHTWLKIYNRFQDDATFQLVGKNTSALEIASILINWPLTSRMFPVVASLPCTPGFLYQCYVCYK